MNELLLKYGCNPNQKPSRIFMKDGGALPIEVLNGRPGYINFLDAFNSWQLVRELAAATRPARRRVLQTRQPGGGRGGPAHGRRVETGLFCRRSGALPYRLRLRPGKRGGPDVLLWRLGCPV